MHGSSAACSWLLESRKRKSQIKGDSGHGAEARENTVRGNRYEDIMKLQIIFFCSLLITISVVTVAQNPTDLNITVPRTSATSGKEMYEAYCAACHGKGGKGDGPVASALKTPPPNLTDLSRRNNGEYPWLLVVNTISGPVGTSAHGSREMPIWGPVFTSMSHQHESEVRQRIANLTDYVKSLQQK